MAWGISPKKIVTIPLEDYDPDHYLTLLYQAMLNQGWHIGYFDHDGIIAYTNISWPSYSEEVSARVKGNTVVIKSECVGYQGLFTDYGKNKKNLDLLFNEIPYAEYHMQEHLEESTQELMNAIPEKQFLNLEDPPMAGKEQLRGFFSPIILRKKYFVTPLLVLLNSLVFLASVIASRILPALLTKQQLGLNPGQSSSGKMQMWLGYNNREHVLNGEVWRLLTSVFQHFSFMHLFFNMVALVYIGSLVECKIGRWNYLLLYLFTGMSASMCSVLFNYTQVSAGASGAIVGLFGVLLALLSTKFYERSARKALLISTVIVVGINIIPIGKGIDHAAHFGGLIFGYILGLIAYAGMTHKNSFINKWGVALSGAVIVTVFVACGLLFSVNYQMEEFNVLIEKTQTMTDELNQDLYGTGGADTITREERLALIAQKGIPEVEKLRELAPRLQKLRLPANKKNAATTMATLIDLQCQYYPLLYREFKEQDQNSYRPKIDSLTELINQVRDQYWQNE